MVRNFDDLGEGCGDFATVLAGTVLCIFRVLHANLLKLLDFFGRKLGQNSASL